jgi:hypothetical protein
MASKSMAPEPLLDDDIREDEYADAARHFRERHELADEDWCAVL